MACDAAAIPNYFAVVKIRMSRRDGHPLAGSFVTIPNEEEDSAQPREGECSTHHSARFVLCTILLLLSPNEKQILSPFLASGGHIVCQMQNPFKRESEHERHRRF